MSGTMRFKMFKGLVKTSRHKRGGLLHGLYVSFPGQPSAALALAGCLKFLRASYSSAAMKWSRSTPLSIQYFSIQPLTAGRHGARSSAAPLISIMCFDQRIPNGRDP
jgi:hypothetical protein